MTAAELIDCLMHCDPNKTVVSSDGRVIEVVEETEILVKHPDKFHPVIRVIGYDTILFVKESGDGV